MKMFTKPHCGLCADSICDECDDQFDEVGPLAEVHCDTGPLENEGEVKEVLWYMEFYGTLVHNADCLNLYHHAMDHFNLDEPL